MTAKSKAPDERKQRLAKALKANLARRKAQAKMKAAAEKPAKD